MMDFDPEKWATPAFVAIGLVISQLFMYGKKVKRRVKITTAELVGDLMQFGVKMVITITTIQVISWLTKKPIDDMWQVVAVTILICTSFDNYFLKLRELALTRILGAGAVLFGKAPANAMFEFPGGEGENNQVKVRVVETNMPLTDQQTKINVPLKSVYKADPVIPSDDQALLDGLDKEE